ncbi:hypothetical protein [Anaerococcus hydrogenalis]|uniref:Uncharacterized protein n=1 Tax=Anaerococcus hydrogenalis TaxID=33029 RepID=A0A2N6UL33_9FIRM|nr:hypothetical protein [Anaerococcus hydrogenalis]MDK7694501.1 hypothetical protein [Anaerococcus hydrogenalis]MDK7696279.1 hypothetical protein [Anaerococcus hydrogenalis]MDK7707528.1 hypothetical protein [Anaerococcus hydrogenalis]PMC82541.1 hypothetical protein CJ192_02080 [Anaerococcus hydrogenalis]
MTSSAEKKPIIEKLEYDYLINDDISSLNTLMSLYDNKNFSNFSKNKYFIKTYIFKNLKKNFWYLSDIDQIIRSLDRSIGKDLDKFEFLLSIKSENKSFMDKKLIDDLEFCAINYYGDSFLFEENQIFTEDNKYVSDTKNKYVRKIYEDKKLIASIRKDVKKYSDTYLKYKVLNLDVNTNKQLAFDMDMIYTEDITINQAMEINDKLVSLFYNIAIDVYANYYWKGLCIEVINRYH